ncbi:hypothetical protein B0H12DRAFT_1244056 [Mycena haematopus]|nr:hypothetical protein B0H12DRAFT_1244056 [Mycena haematopus]
MSERIENAATAMQRLLESLPAPTEEDSPGTTNAWQNLFGVMLGATDLIAAKHADFPSIFEDVDGIQEEADTTEMDVDDGDEDLTRVNEDAQEDSTVDGDVDHDEDEEEVERADGEEHLTLAQIKARRRAQAQLRVTRRSQVIIGEGSKAGVTPDELFTLITVPIKVTSEKAEDRALSRVMRGFVNAGNQSAWKQELSNHVNEALPQIQDFCEESIEFDGESDKLLDRDLMLSHTESAREVDYCLTAILHKAETIKFAHAWNQLTGKGSLKAKHQYNQRLFRRHRAQDFEGLSKAAANDLIEEMHAELTEFIRCREGVVTARNRLYFAYDNFGTAVLIDPFFTITNLGKRTKNFQSLLDSLMHLVPPPETRKVPSRLADQEQENRYVLYGLLRVLCSDDEAWAACKEYLDSFFAEYPSRVAVQLA